MEELLKKAIVRAYKAGYTDGYLDSFADSEHIGMSDVQIEVALETVDVILAPLLKEAQGLAVPFDPYTNGRPWGLLSEEERAEIEGADAVERYNGAKWVAVPPGETITFHTTYRAIKKPEPVLDVYPFDLVSDDYEWFARDERGWAYAYKTKPECLHSEFLVNQYGMTARIDHIKGYQRGTVDWKGSLQRRPQKSN